MQLAELYRRWVSAYEGLPLDRIESVAFSSYVGEGSHDLDSEDFSTFAGCEVWSADVVLKDGTHRHVALWDQNPVRMIMDFARDNSIHIEAEPMTREQQDYAAIEADLNGR